MHSAIRLPLNFDPIRLQDDLIRVSQTAWSGHFNQRIYEGDWSVVPLRAIQGSPIPAFSFMSWWLPTPASNAVSTASPTVVLHSV